jgi:uncharacterized repeat protein (TIGR03803 family)
MARIFVLAMRLLFLLALALSALLTPARQAAAISPTITEQTLYDFCSQSNCTDGVSPQSSLIRDGAGNFYGTTGGGGANNKGVVFELSPVSGGGWNYKVLYSFCQQSACADGGSPGLGGLVVDAAGNLYGTVEQGGLYDSGAVFKLSQNQGVWSETVLYSFCAIFADDACVDGNVPEAGVIIDGAGNLYGTTPFGGGGNFGTVFMLTPNGNGQTPWTETVLYSGGGQSNTPLLMDGLGNLYGTTQNGGPVPSSGSVFMLTPNATRTAWTPTILHYFCGDGLCDGQYPDGGLVMDGAGNLYGPTEGGGANSAGTVYQLTPNQSRTAWNFSTLYPFASGGAGGPFAGLIIDGSGNLYGTQTSNGNPYYGTVFELNPAQGAASFQVLYQFTGGGGGSGASPEAPLFLDGAGNLYGTAGGGGNNTQSGQGSGTIFEISTGTTPGVALEVGTTGGGTVGSSPSGIACGDTCTAGYASGTQVTLTATPAIGYTLAGWIGGGCSGTGQCVTTLTADTSVNAAFAPTAKFALTVGNSGGGIVSSSPAGIACGSTCSANFAVGTQIGLSEIPFSGFTFAGWGGGCSGTGTCVITPTANTTVTASFVQDFTLSVSTVGKGVVGSSPAGIDCGKTCTASFPAGSEVQPIAYPDSGWKFDEWRGACHGKTEHDCHVTMDAAKSVIAKFEKK